MKKGYKRLLVFSVFLILLFLSNTFIFNIFSSYKMILLLLVLIPIFNIFFVLEKDRHRYINDVLFEVIVFTISFFLLYYILGFVVGLARNQNYFTLYGLKTFIIPTIVYCILREYLRYNMLCKSEGSKLVTIIVVLVFITMDITNSLYFSTFNSKYEILRYVALILLPTISKNISYSYISRKIGYKPVILFDLIFSLYPYILPLVPNPNEYIVSIIYLVVPIILALRLNKFFNNKEDYFLPSTYYKKRLTGAIVPTIIVLTLIYFYSGYFRFHAIAIASGSMEPQIKKGDVVIVDKSNKNKDFKKGQIIAYWKDENIIVHRIVKKVKLDNSYVYYTKGDANEKIDDVLIKEKMIIGKVNHKISYIGYPTVWFSER